MDVKLYGLLTTQPNAVVKPIHEKAMPVILRSQDEIDTWLSAPVEEALKLQRPLPDDFAEDCGDDCEGPKYASSRV